MQMCPLPPGSCTDQGTAWTGSGSEGGRYSGSINSPDSDAFHSNLDYSPSTVCCMLINVPRDADVCTGFTVSGQTCLWRNTSQHSLHVSNPKAHDAPQCPQSKTWSPVMHSGTHLGSLAVAIPAHVKGGHLVIPHERLRRRGNKLRLQRTNTLSN